MGSQQQVIDCGCSVAFKPGQLINNSGNSLVQIIASVLLPLIYLSSNPRLVAIYRFIAITYSCRYLQHLDV
jgi:hypothetical protein